MAIFSRTQLALLVCLTQPMCMSPIWCCKQITSKRHVHRPTVLNSLSAGDGRLHRIVLIFRCPRTITDISVIRLSLMWCVCSSNDDAARARVKAPFADRFFHSMLFFLCLRLPRDLLPWERSHRSTTLAREHHFWHKNNNV